MGRTILWNLISSPFGGTVFPVNPKRPSVLGIKAYPSIADVPEQVDLAVIVTPAPTVPGIIQRMRATRRAGRDRHLGRLQGSSARKARSWSGRFSRRRGSGKMRIIGPNCLGVMSPLYGAERDLRRDHGAAGIGRFHQPERRAVHGDPGLEPARAWSGFSAFVSIGSMLDVGWGDLIDYLGDDPRTRSIVIYMESIGDARVVPVGGARSGAEQADHRDQGRAHGGRRPRRRRRTPER